LSSLSPRGGFAESRFDVSHEIKQMLDEVEVIAGEDTQGEL
jgi:hypothetical protein